MRNITVRKVKVIKMMPGLEVRYAVEEDGEYWRQWLHEPGVLRWFPMIGENEIEESVNRMKAHCRYRCVLTAVYNGEVAGIAYLNLHPYRKISHHCLITIIVGGKFRGQGIGSTLLEHLDRLAKEGFGLEILHLEVYEGNPAIRLYRRVGYREFGFQSHWIKESEGEYRGKIFMAKNL
jgi:putative acetyltransferase